LRLKGGTIICASDTSHIVNCEFGIRSVISAHVWMEDVIIGDFVYVGSHSLIAPGTILENGAEIGTRVTFLDDDDGKRTIVGYGATIGDGAIIAPGISIGMYAKVGAGAYVTKDVKARTQVCGNPATAKAGIVVVR